MTDDNTLLLQPDPVKIREKLRRYALYLLARRDHTAYELKQKFARKDYHADLIDSVLARLEESGLINSERFAESYAHYRRGKGYGPKRIIMELQAKGVTEAVIAEHVKITDNAWFTEIRTIWRKQFKGRQPADYQDRAKQLRFLYNRGFTQDQINSIFKLDDNDDQ
jgi:regulatory protein